MNEKRDSPPLGSWPIATLLTDLSYLLPPLYIYFTSRLEGLFFLSADLLTPLSPVELYKTYLGNTALAGDVLVINVGLR